jgi:hypothetical protein
MESFEHFFYQIRDGLLSIDPVTWIENNLNLDGKPFRINGNGYKPFADIYRYIGVKALERDSKPIIIVKGRQVGATTMAAALECFFMASGSFGTLNRQPIRVVHCFPLLDLAASYSKAKLSPMITGAKQIEKNPKNGRGKSIVEAKIDKTLPSNDSLHFKQFIGGNQLWVESTGINGDRLMGKTCDVFFADEAQKMRKNAIANSTKILSQAQYGKKTKGVQVYFGTPLQSGSNYWENWNRSSQQYYHLGCEKCNEYFPLFTGNDDWEKIWLYEYIVRCTKCGFEQNKLKAAENGKWIALNKSHETEYVGFHINQLYNPMYSKEDIIKEHPDNSPVNTERAYRNEVLGMFYSGSSAPITPEEIYEKCADHGRKFTKSISITENRRSYAGFDWGDLIDIEPGMVAEGESGQRSGGQSYSCGVILTAETPHILSIEFASILKRNDPDYKREVVEQMFRQYSVKLGAGDIGYANDLTYNLQKEHGSRFLATRSCPSVTNHFRFQDSIFPKEIQFEKDYLIKEVYDLMKAGRIRFPFGNYEQIGWLIDHCCSMELKPAKDRSGELKLRYVKGSSPNDGFMALLNAYLAYKFDISQGFTVHDPNRLQTDLKERPKILAVTGYVPKMNPLRRA